MTIHHTHHFKATALRAGCVAIAMAGLLYASPQANAQLSRGQKSFGPRVGYVSSNSSAAAGLEFQVAVAKHVRLAPEALIVFRHRDRDALGIGLNVQLPYAIAPKFVAYPLVGLQYMSWGLHNTDPETAKDVTTHANRFGGNAGAGIEFNCTSSLKLSVEGRYTLLSSYSTAIVCAGISYVF